MRRLLQLYWLVVCVGWPTSIGGLRPTAQNDWPAESDWVALPNQHGHFRHHQHRYGAGHDVLPHAQQFLWPQETDMCYDPRCSCHWTLVGYNVTCHCSPQDQVTARQPALCCRHPVLAGGFAGFDTPFDWAALVPWPSIHQLGKRHHLSVPIVFFKPFSIHENCSLTGFSTVSCDHYRFHNFNHW